MATRTYAQIPSNASLFIVSRGPSTGWIYPEVDINTGLATTTHRYRRDGNDIVFPDMTNLKSVYYDIYATSVASNPGPPGNTNPGYTIQAGTILKDLAKEIRLRLEDGTTVIVWRLVQQLTAQAAPNAGCSPKDTIGYITTFNAKSGYSAPDLDDVSISRLG